MFAGNGGVGGTGGTNASGGAGSGSGSGNTGAGGGQADAGGATQADAGAAQSDGGTGGASPFMDTADGIHAFLTFEYSISVSAIPQIGPRTDFIWGADQPRVSAWHAANPKTFVSSYIAWNQDQSGHDITYWKANHPDWVVYKCDRSTPATVSGYSALILDISNPAVQAWQMDMVKTAVSQGYDGIAFDLFQLDNLRGACGIFRNGQWVQLYNGTSSDPTYTNDVLSWLHNMHDAMHQLPKPMGVVPNYVLDRDPNDPVMAQVVANLDGVLDEEAFGNYAGYTITGSRWLSKIQFMEKLQQAGKAYFAISGFTPLDTNAIQWTVASYLMGKEKHAANFLAQSGGSGYGKDEWHPEYAAAIGSACGPMAMQGNVYARSFAHALVLVNPSSSSAAHVTLPAGAQYTDQYGKAYSGALDLGAHSGIVLMLNGGPNC
jgi:hypothetical protein